MSGVARFASNAAQRYSTPITTRTLSTTTTPALQQAAVLVRVEIATSIRCMGKVTSRAGNRVCYELLGDCIFAHSVKNNLPRNEDVIKLVLPIPSDEIPTTNSPHINTF